MLRLRPLRLCLLLALGVSIFAACTGESDDPLAVVENWECFEVVAVSSGGAGGEGALGAAGSEASSAGDKPGCECFGVESHQSVDDPRPRVNRCGAESTDSSGWQCCYAWEKDDGSFGCLCEDAPAEQQAAAYCADQAEKRDGEVVERCPPTPLDNTTYCAFDGESCDPDYLDELHLSGCCEDLACVENAHGVPVCVGK